MNCISCLSLEICTPYLLNIQPASLKGQTQPNPNCFQIQKLLSLSYAVFHFLSHLHISTFNSARIRAGEVGKCHYITEMFCLWSVHPSQEQKGLQGGLHIRKSPAVVCSYKEVWITAILQRAYSSSSPNPISMALAHHSDFTQQQNFLITKLKGASQEECTHQDSMKWLDMWWKRSFCRYPI